MLDAVSEASDLLDHKKKEEFELLEFSSFEAVEVSVAIESVVNTLSKGKQNQCTCTRASN